METNFEARLSLNFECNLLAKPRKFTFVRLVASTLILTLSGVTNHFGPVCANPGALVPPAFCIPAYEILLLSI